MAEIAEQVRQHYPAPEVDAWEGSPFGWIRSAASRRRGAIGEKLVAGWASANGFAVERSPDSEADRVIRGQRIEVKFSMLWETGIYKFQQVRDQDYAHLFCLGISPFEVHAWMVPKEVLREHVIGVQGQHTGASGADTAWFSVLPAHPPAWLSPWGGTLEEAKVLLEEL
jgi:hypothetical protein